MKKNYLTYAGIVSALVLTGMFVSIWFSSSPFPFLPSATSIDPVTDANVDENNMLILTGTTTLPLNTFLFLNITALPGSLPQDDGTGRTRDGSSVVITPGDWGRNRWEGQIVISDFRPAEYTVAMEVMKLADNYTIASRDTVATAHFVLGDENAGAGVVRKKTRAIPPFIRINPADRTPAGDLKITGTTSILPGTPLDWKMSAVTDRAGSSPYEYGGTARVTGGTDGINRWAVLPGTFMEEPAQYRFSIAGNATADSPPAGSVSATAVLDVSPRQGTLQNTTGTTQASPAFITIDALPDIRADNVYMITGTTSLPAGEDLLVQVYPVSFETNYNFSLEGREAGADRTLSGAAVFGGATGMTPIVNGSGGEENLWSFRLETYQISGGQYRINVSNDRFGNAASVAIPEDLFCTRIFMIAE